MRTVAPELGAAWNNDTTLRVALFDLATNPAWNVEGEPVTSDELLIETRTVERFSVGRWRAGRSRRERRCGSPCVGSGTCIYGRGTCGDSEWFPTTQRRTASCSNLKAFSTRSCGPLARWEQVMARGVVPRDDSTLRVGDEVSGGGGYLQVAGEYGIPFGCLPSTGEGRGIQCE